jgi:hypothetical protein
MLVHANLLPTYLIHRVYMFTVLAWGRNSDLKVALDCRNCAGGSIEQERVVQERVVK